MSPQVPNLLIFFGLAGAVLILWIISIVVVYWDVSRRNLVWKQQISWIAVVALLPLVGALIYLLARGFSSKSILNRKEKSSVQKRQTMAMQFPRKEVYLPTISLENPPPPRRGDTRPPFRPGARNQSLPPTCSLMVVSGPSAGKEFHIHNFPVTIGRGLEAALRLEEDPSVSRSHAEIYQKGQWVHIRDLDSRHGTLVNGNWIIDQRLEPGDEIRVGDSLFLFNVRERVP